MDHVDLDVFDAYNPNCYLGVEITKQRQIMLDELYQPFQNMICLISVSDDVSLSFSGIASHSPDQIRDFFENQLNKVRDDEIRLRKCLSGPHRDDLNIKINGLNARKFASQGQVRSIVWG